MKKLVLKISITALFTLCLNWISCSSPSQKKEEQEKQNGQTPEEKTEDFSDKVIWQAKESAGEEFITISDDYMENQYEIKSSFEGKPPVIDFEGGLDLTGYNYLNVEFYCPEGDYNMISFTGFSYEPYEKVARTKVSGLKEVKIVQMPFGVNHGEWPDPGENGKPKVQPNVSNKLNRLFIWAFDQFGGDNGASVPGVKVYVKTITATNKKIEKDPEKDFTIFSAVENEGHKITTVKEESAGNGNIIFFDVDEIGETDLEKYKYLNFELYSPNINNQKLIVEGLSLTYRTGEENEEIIHMSSYIPNKSKIFQVPFKTSVHDKVLSYLWFYVYDSDSNWIEGIDIYVKRIWATNSDLTQTIDDSLLRGQWFFDYGSNQDDFANEVLTVNDDKTIVVLRDVPNHPEEYEYYEGDYDIINDEDYGLTLQLNLVTGLHPVSKTMVEAGISLFYDLHSLTADDILMYRYKRTFPDGTVQTFNPGVKNHYMKIHNGNAQNLTGIWHVNKLATPNCTWNETWVYKSDGTMEDFYEEGDDKSWFKGTYEVLIQGDAAILHQTLTQESSDNITFTEMENPMEFWYEYKTYGPNLINVNCIKNKMNGNEQEKNPPVINYYYREQ